MSARCVRPDCDLPAAAQLSADFTLREGWLRNVDLEHPYHDYLLCARHADTLTLPINWVFHDERRPHLVLEPEPEPEPAPQPEPEPAPTLERHYDPADEVDESMPLLSRAFRAAMPGAGGQGSQ